MAKKEKEVKTNAMRILDREKIPYEHFSYEAGDFVDGIQTADKLGLPHELVYKTLVTVGNDRNHYVFVLPIEKELDFKKCAKSVGVKNVEMIHVIRDADRRLCGAPGADLRLRGKDRRADQALPEGPCEGHQSGVCRPRAELKTGQRKTKPAREKKADLTGIELRRGYPREQHQESPRLRAESSSNAVRSLDEEPPH